MRENKSVICVTCPVGCKIEVGMDDGKIMQVRGNRCKRGEQYAKAEVTCPVRTLTTTVRVMEGDRPLVSAKTAAPISRELLMAAMREVSGAICRAPIRYWSGTLPARESRWSLLPACKREREHRPFHRLKQRLGKGTAARPDSFLIGLRPFPNKGQTIFILKIILLKNFQKFIDKSKIHG